MLTTQTVAYLEVPTSEVSVVVLVYRYQLGLFYVPKLYVENWARLKKTELPKVDTVWKFYDYSVTQILREINFGESRRLKTAIFATFSGSEFSYLIGFSLKSLQKPSKGAQMHKNQNSNFKVSKHVKMTDFALLESPKLISRKSEK